MPPPEADVKKPSLLPESDMMEKLDVPTLSVPAQSAFHLLPVAPRSKLERLLVYEPSGIRFWVASAPYIDEVAFRTKLATLPIEKREPGDEVPTPTFPPIKVAAGPVPLCVTARVGIAEVEEAKRPPWNQKGVVVAWVVVP